MEEPKERLVHRPQVQDLTESASAQKTNGMPWRKVAILATPIVVGLINLVDAYRVKQEAIFEGDQLHRTAVESGAAQAKAIERQGSKAADAIYSQRTDGAKKKAESIIYGATAKALELREQGMFLSVRDRLMAQRTREAIQQWVDQRMKR